MAGRQADQSKQQIVSSIMEDTDVQFSWLLCLDIDDEFSNELLKNVVEMWLTICWFSMANAWIDYKQANESNTAKKNYEKVWNVKKLQLDN